MSKRKSDKSPTISDQLRAIIRERGLKAYGVGKLAGVDPGVVQRFMTGERTLRLETVDKIATALDLQLTYRPDPQPD